MEGGRSIRSIAWWHLWGFTSNRTHSTGDNPGLRLLPADNERLPGPVRILDGPIHLGDDAEEPREEHHFRRAMLQHHGLWRRNEWKEHVQQVDDTTLIILIFDSIRWPSRWCAWEDPGTLSSSPPKPAPASIARRIDTKGFHDGIDHLLHVVICFTWFVNTRKT